MKDGWNGWGVLSQNSKRCRLERDLGSRLDGDPCLAGGNLLENVTLGSEKEDIKLHWSFFFTFVVRLKV